MYCRKCGYRLVSGEKYCTNCDEPVEAMEACGGFWGLVGEEKVTTSIPDILEDEDKDVKEVKVEKVQKESKGIEKTKFFGVIALSCLLLLLSVFLVFKVNSISKEKAQLEKIQNNLRADKENLKQMYSEWENVQNTFTENGYENPEDLLNELNELSTDNERLNQIISQWGDSIEVFINAGYENPESVIDEISGLKDENESLQKEIEGLKQENENKNKKNIFSFIGKKRE